jgi:hypothetical protein
MDLVSGIAQQTSRRLLWVVTVNRVAWRYISGSRAHRLALNDTLELPAWTEEQIGELIDTRTQTAGIEPDFERLRLPRGLDDADYPTLSERNRAKTYRLIWDISGGSPATAVRLWADTLRLAQDGRIVVCAPELPRTGDLELLSISFLLVFRVIVQCELAAVEDIVGSLRFPLDQVRSALRFMLLRDWIEIDDGRYRITDTWYGTVIRVLNRRNLIAAREGVGVL